MNTNKIGIIIPSNIMMAPYLQYYTSILDKEEVKYITISWNRFGLQEKADYIFNFRTENSNRKRVLVGHIRFALFCKKVIKKEKINKIIILTIAPAFFLGVRFLNKYRERLIIDVRDDTPFRKKFPGLFKRVVDKAYMIAVSSFMFSDWFERETILCHNVDSDMIARYKNDKPKVPSIDKIRLVFAGSMREEKMNIQIVDTLKNDKRYTLCYIGRQNAGQSEIRNYVKENSIWNVMFEGAYVKEDIVDIYREKADLVNAFREESSINTNALPNKLYDAALSGVPIAVFSHNVAMATYVSRFSLGIVINEDMSLLKDSIFDAMKTFDYCAFKKGREEFINQVEMDNKKFEIKVLEFLHSLQ